MKELRKELKNRSFKPVYLFYGTESYLVRLYGKELSAAVVEPGAEMMNMDVLEGKGVTAQGIKDAADTAPFLSERRLVLCRDTGLFTTGKKSDSDLVAAYLPRLPETTILAFIEAEADKRGRMFKRVAELGRAVEFKRPSEKELVDWIGRTLRKAGLTIDPAAAAYLLRTAPEGMDNLMREMEKLISYIPASRGTAEITQTDIDAVCTKSLETRIFELVDAVGRRSPERALDIFNNMLLMKESPIMVIGMLARQFRILLQCKYMSSRRATADEIARAAGLHGFVVKNCLKQSENFTMDQLYRAFNDCVEADVSVKTGLVGDSLAVETIIVKHSSK